nr:unnamed protein product [Digitaria exilis]
MKAEASQLAAMPASIERDLHMATGDGEHSYTKNSRIQLGNMFSICMKQEKAMFQIKPVLEEATRKVYTSVLPRTMVVADLGCSSGPNTLRFVSEVIGIIAHYSKELGLPHNHRELQFFLNDLPGNDFNNLFELVDQFKKLTTRNLQGEELPPCYISGLPGSFYTRLFPCQSVHLFHSLFCLQWRSQGLLKKEKLDSFYLPIYSPSVGEVVTIVEQSGLFNMNYVRLFETNWDPYDDSESDVVHDSVRSGVNVAKCIRAVMEPLVASHFGETILDRLFKEYAQRVAKHLDEEKTKHAVIVLSMKKVI